MKLTYINKKLTPLEKMDIMELKVKLVAEAGYRCFKCNDVLGGDNPAQLAHILSRKLISKCGYEVINHPMNLKVSCGDCNSYAMIIPDKLAHENNIRRELGLEDIKR